MARVGIIREPEVAEYEKIRKYVVSQLAKAGSTPMRLASNRELAKQFGVSHPTVLKALKDLVADGYLTVKPGVGTFTRPSMSNACEGTKICGFLYGDGKQTFLTRSYWCFSSAFSEKILAFSERIQMQPCHLTASRGKIGDELLNMGLDGMICVFPDDEIFPALRSLRDSGMPVVSIGMEKVPGVSSFFYDFRIDNRNVAELMLAEGRRRLMLMLPKACGFTEPAIAGVEDAFAAHGFPYDKSMVVYDSEVERNGFAHTLSALKPDGIIFNCGISPYWKTLKGSLDINDACRLYNGVFSVSEDMD